MYFLALFALIFTLVFSALLGNPIKSILDFYDVPSLLIITLITIPMLLASGLFGDLKRAFKVVMFKNTNYTKLELQRSLEAVKLTIKLILCSGIFGFLIGLIRIVKINAALPIIGLNLSVNLIILLYSLFGCFIFLPIHSMLKVMILSSSKE